MPIQEHSSQLSLTPLSLFPAQCSLIFGLIYIAVYRARTRSRWEGWLPWAQLFTVSMGGLPSGTRLTEVVTAAVILASERLLGVESAKLIHQERGGGGGGSLASLPWALDDPVLPLVV